MLSQTFRRNPLIPKWCEPQITSFQATEKKWRATRTISSTQPLLGAADGVGPAKHRWRAVQTIPSTSDVSRCCIKSRMKPISLRALSNITCGSSESHRRQFGAITIARLLASIFVTAATSGAANFCHIKNILCI